MVQKVTTPLCQPLDDRYEGIYSRREGIIKAISARYGLDYYWSAELFDQAVEILYQQDDVSCDYQCETCSFIPYVSYIMKTAGFLYKNWSRLSETQNTPLTNDQGDPLPFHQPISLEDEIDGRLNLEIVQSHLSQLRIRDRKLILARISGYSFYEIGDMLKITEIAARQACRRALNKLKIRLRDDDRLSW